ncbi:hypothetical protein LZ31DRAFT_485594 [Colletotrichum somersetense]|nr:hypothetical protein LZ31DRAFT_485594 [Colletotrichum somersetense]
MEDHYDIISTNGTVSLVWHRKNRTVAISRTTRLCDLASIHHIFHPNLATIYGIFLSEKGSYVTYEHLEIDLMNLSFTTEVELASALSQVTKRIHGHSRALLSSQ